MTIAEWIPARWTFADVDPRRLDVFGPHSRGRVFLHLTGRISANGRSVVGEKSPVHSLTFRAPGSMCDNAVLSPTAVRGLGEGVVIRGGYARAHFAHLAISLASWRRGQRKPEIV